MRTPVTEHPALRTWALAILDARVFPAELACVRGFIVIPRCTRGHHGPGCGCARGSVRLYKTNHGKHSMSRKFDEIRRVLGAVPWQEDGDVEVLC
jgi:hypothetical protein